MQKVCIVIPCYNEQKRLPINEFIEYSNNENNLHFLFINDGSTDLTMNVLNHIKEGREDKIFVLDLKENKGKGEAVRNGILEAKKWKNFSVIGFLDADLSTPLSEASRLISLFDNNIFFIFGSRIKRVGVEIKRKWYRHVFGRIFATFASSMLKLEVYDTQCGAKFFKKEIIDILFLEKFKSNWIFDLEIFYRFSNNQKKTDINLISKEIPLEKWEDINGTKIKLIHLIKIPYDMIKLYFHYNLKK